MFLVSLSIATTFDSDSGLNALVENQDVFATIRLGLDGFDPASGPTLAPEPAPPGGLRVYVDSDVPNILDRFDLSSLTSDPQFANIDVTSFTPNSDNSGFAVTVNEGATVGAFNLRLLDNAESDPNLSETLDGLVNATFTLRTQQEVPADEDQITGISDYITDPFATVNTLFLADDASQLPSVEPSEPLDPTPSIEVGISVSTDFENDVDTLVEDQGTTATVRFDLSEPAPEGGLRVYFETGTSQVLDRLNLFDILLNPRLENIDVATFVTDFDDSGAAITIDEGATFGSFQVDIADNVEVDTVPFAILDGVQEIALTLQTSNDVSSENETFVVGVSDYAIDPDAASNVVLLADTASQVLDNQPELILNPETQLVTVDDSSPTVSVLWDRAVQLAVINTAPGPTVASRAYGIVHTAMFDAWAAYDETAIATQLGDDLQRPAVENTDANKTEAMSFAAYRVLTELFPSEVAVFDELMMDLGFDPSNLTTDTTTAAGIGNVSAEALMAFRREDGSNQLGNYVDTTDYTPVNTSDNIVDIERWTSERVPIDSPDARLQQFLTPQWGDVEPFGIDTGDSLRPPAPQPFLLVDDVTADLEAQTITLADGAVVDITPDLVGTVINPEFISQAEEVVDFSANLTDEQKLIAEFWEDGGGTSFPPGTWMTFGQFVSAREDNSLDEDAKLFFGLGNAVFDAGVATWEAKVFYDYVRPVRAIRSLGELGLIGEFNADLGGFAIDAWAGPEQGTQTILATDFTTYQTPGSDPSPPFAEYTSGHSAFSAAGATILELFSGSDAFGADITFASGESRFEPDFTPQAETTLVWETFADAADEAGLSRLYGGIHFEEGDINGRILGQEVGAAVFETAQFFINGGEDQDFFIGTRERDHFVGTEADETIYGRSGDDRLRGNLGDDQIFGGDGNERLWGDLSSRDKEGGNDTIYGGAGDDLIRGNGGNDWLFGNEGDDHLRGDEGDDLLRGGAGNDRLRGDFSRNSDGEDTFVLAIGEGTDTIEDFGIGEDFIGLADGLLFEQLVITQQSRRRTLIEVGDETLAILKNVNADALIASADTAFTVV